MFFFTTVCLNKVWLLYVHKNNVLSECRLVSISEHRIRYQIIVSPDVQHFVRLCQGNIYLLVSFYLITEDFNFI